MIAAAEPLGDPTLLRFAAAGMGLAADGADPAEVAGLLNVGQRVSFRHPLVRSAAHRDAPADERRSAHRALADATDAKVGPDHRAWHRAHAAVGPDEDVARELEFSAGRAQVRGGTSAAAAFLTRAAELTPDPAVRGGRPWPPRPRPPSPPPTPPTSCWPWRNWPHSTTSSALDSNQLRARLLFSRSRGNGNAPALFESARRFAETARRFETVDHRLAGEAHLDAIDSAMYVGRLGGVDLVRETAAAAITSESWLWQAFPMAHEALVHESWDDDAWHRLASDAVRLATEAGALEVLPRALVNRADVHVKAGEFSSASRLIAEAHEISTVLYNGLGRYDAALASVRPACDCEDVGLYSWSLIEMIEAAVRAGEKATAAEAFERLAGRTTAAGTDWAHASRARSQALLHDGAAAEDHYVEAIDRYGRTRIGVHLAHARLLRGEWLRRQNRRTDARTQLRLAHESLSRMGAVAFAGRARRELLATGEKARKRATVSGDALTPQEQQIAELAGAGLTNPEVGAQPFISAHTVEWHLRKIFAKLSIRSRRELCDNPWHRAGT